MRKPSVLLLPLVACTILVPLTFPQSNDSQRPRRAENLKKNLPFITELEHQVFELVNRQRFRNGSPLLVWNEQAAQIARLHSRNMASLGFFSHVGLDGKRVSGRADAVGLRNWRMIGENIAYNQGFSDPVERAFNRWMESPGHRKSLLLKNWKESGVGITVAPDGTYFFTQVFVLRKK